LISWSELRDFAVKYFSGTTTCCSSWRLWKKDSPSQESGLLGPVTLRGSE
jgi:hypothetical protein